LKTHRSAESRCDWAKLHLLRGERTLAELASACMISPAALEYAEAHDAGLSESMIDRLAAFFDLPADALRARSQAVPLELVSSLGMGSSLRIAADD